ncbi:hypothetical protein [Schlesneria sp. DSM 10557]|uniref:hypothetical protein n=1 Tax=Schlesneria sp. DSM 10557 TaxID=3044399 RepID=UPI0035A05EF0
MTWWFVLVAVLMFPLIRWAMWREDSDGIRTKVQIERRSQLSFADFYAQYYADSEISPWLVSRIRDIVSEQLGIPAGCIRPTDNLLQTNLADTIYYIVEFAEEFELPESRQDTLSELEGTFDNVVRYVALRSENAGQRSVRQE